MSEQIFVLERSSDATTYVFIPLSDTGIWCRTDNDIFIVHQDSQWTVQNSQGAILGAPVSADHTAAFPPEGVWKSQKDGKSFEYVGRLVTASSALSNEYEEQERLRSWDFLLDKIPRVTDGPMSVLDLGCGAGAVSRLLGQGERERCTASIETP